jgi:hypothetical protein
LTSSARRSSSARPRSAWSRSRPRKRTTKLHLRALSKELREPPLLPGVVMGADLRPQTDLFQADLCLVPSPLLCLLLFLIAELRVIHHAAHGRIGRCSDLDEVEGSVLRVCARLLGCTDSNLRPVFVDEPHARRANGLVCSERRLRRARRLECACARLVPLAPGCQRVSFRRWPKPAASPERSSAGSVSASACCGRRGRWS